MLENDGDQIGPIVWIKGISLHRVKEDMNILHTTKRRKANWIEHTLCRKCLLKRVIEYRKRSNGTDEEEGVDKYWMTLRKMIVEY